MAEMTTPRKEARRERICIACGGCPSGHLRHINKNVALLSIYTTLLKSADILEEELLQPHIYICDKCINVISKFSELKKHVKEASGGEKENIVRMKRVITHTPQSKEKSSKKLLTSSAILSRKS